MKKIVFALSLVSIELLMQSCYCSTVCVGDMKPDDPAVCVNTVHNPHFIGGLVGGKDIEGKDYVAGKQNYKFKKYHSFVDLLLGSITLGIYTPTTTKIYLPASEYGK